MGKDKALKEAKEILRSAGYTVARGVFVNVNVSDFEVAACASGGCTGGCYGGCYTCNPGNSNPKSDMNIYINVPKEGIVEDIATIIKTPELAGEGKVAVQKKKT